MGNAGLLGSHPGALHARAATIALIVLAHVLLVVCAWQAEVVRGAVARATAPHGERYFVEVAIPALAQARPPAVAPLASAPPAPSRAAASATPAPAEAAPRAIEPAPVRSDAPPVRAEPPPLHSEPAALRSEPAPPEPAAPAAAGRATQAAAAAPGPAIAQQASAAQFDAALKVIKVLSFGSSKASYTFPAISGLDADARPLVYHVEIGDYPDMQTALVNHVIAQIRARYPDGIVWDSRVKNAKVWLSMHKEDNDEVARFLRVELFGRHQASTY